MNAYLAGLLAEKLVGVLKEAGFQEVLRISEPHVTQFQRGSEVLTLQTSYPRSHHQLVVVESETVDVDPLVGRAARRAILEVSGELLGSLPWIDWGAVREEVESHTARIVGY